MPYTPTEATLVKADLFIKELQRTSSVKAAYTSIGWGKAYTYQLREKWPRFARRWDDALAHAAGEVHRTMYEKALAGDMRALMTMNQVLNPELFLTSQQVTHTGTVFHSLIPTPNALQALPEGDSPHAVLGLEPESALEAEFENLEADVQ